jgi:hypothetical protein
MALLEADLLDLIALCAALSIDATYQKNEDLAAKQRMTTTGQLAEALGLNMAQYWSPTVETFFGRVNKTAILNAVAEAQGEAKARKLDGLKKPVMAAEAVNMIFGAGWLPPVLRTKGQSIASRSLIGAQPNSSAPLPSPLTWSATPRGVVFFAGGLILDSGMILGIVMLLENI